MSDILYLVGLLAVVVLAYLAYQYIAKVDKLEKARKVRSFSLLLSPWSYKISLACVVYTSDCTLWMMETAVVAHVCFVCASDNLAGDEFLRVPPHGCPAALVRRDCLAESRPV